MKIDPQSVYVGMGIIGAAVSLLTLLRYQLLRMFAVTMAAFLAFELLCFVTGSELVVAIWWVVHLPSTVLLGADEILERHGRMVSTSFHIADFFIWWALITGIRWFLKQRCGVAPHGAADTPLN